MPTLEICSPQPTRNLKRKASQLDYSLFHSSHDRPKKRLDDKSTLPDSIYHWLEDLSPPLLRSRSDTYLLRDSCQSRSSRSSRSSEMPRPKTTQPAAIARPPTPQSSQSGNAPFAVMQAPASRKGEQSRSDSPAQSLIAPSTGELQEDEKKVASRVESPNYRKKLKNHGVYIDSWDVRGIPEAAKVFAQGVIEKARTTPEPSAEDLSKIRERLAKVVEGDEGLTREAFAATGLFEIPQQHADQVVNGTSLPFDRKGLPHTHGYYFPPIPAPRPDLQYGYDHYEFSTGENGVMINHRISPYAKPSTAGYWPFFLVEFKAASRQGTHFIGENQSAGSGAHCVNSVETLLDYISTERPKERTIHSMVFSCVADGQHGTIWVHWQECRSAGKSIYVSTELQDYTWKHDAKMMLDFRKAIRNVIDHGVEDRLPRIKEALTSLVDSLPVWNTADKLARRRSLDSDDGAGGSQSSKRKVK